MNCADCGKQVSRQNKTGYCLPCFNLRLNSDQDARARQRAAMERLWADPTHRAKMQAVAIRIGVEARKNPAFREWQRENGKRLFREVLSRPDVVEKTLCKDARDRANRTRREAQLAWCPPEYRDQYTFLVRRKKLPMAEAREITLNQIKADLAALSPFERQMRALEKGAKLVANDRAPMFGEALKTA